MMDRVPTELERVAAVLAEEPVVEVAPRREPVAPSEWIRQNLFSGWFSGILTIFVGAVVGYLGFGLLRWAFLTADWTVIKANLRLYMVGRFPPDELWRVWACVYLVTALAGLSWGVTRKRLAWTVRKAATRGALAVLVLASLAYLLDGVRIWVLVGAVVILYAAAVMAGRLGALRLHVPVIVGWVLTFPLIILLLRGFGGVPPERWGGFLLNVLVAVVGIVLSFPIGIALALGRRSTLPVIRTVCIGIIEFVRGAPLYTWLLFGLFVLPFLLPAGLVLPNIVRAMIVVTVFSSAYVAEIVRGGLQGVHHGQYEAARAIGLSTTKMMAFIVLPQALRSTIPAMISHFISLFKDTSLLAVIGFIEALRIARIAPQGQFSGDLRETLIFAGLLFWVVAFAMSRWSQRLERRLGVGER